MGIVTNSKFHLYKEKILSLQLPLSDKDVMNSNFLIESDEKKNLEIYYTPFDYINEKACVVIAGITPGLHQMKKAFTTVIDINHQNLSDEEILHQVKKSASFEGTMRNNLVSMLDELGLHTYLNIESSRNLFSSASHLVYNTSILPYAVFFNKKNYSGSRPDIIKTEMLCKFVRDYFAKDICRIQKPLIIPLGVNVSKVFENLIKNQWVESSSILKGFPHPSGSNGHRHRQFQDYKEEMKRQIEKYFKGE